MCGNQRFFVCKHCGNLVGLIEDEGVPLVCCGEKMSELVPNTVEASVEKHMPVVSVTDDRIDIQVGSVLHPMEDEHQIVFVYVETDCGGQRKCLKGSKEAKLSFRFSDDKPSAVYAYCNLHGLWRTDI